MSKNIEHSVFTHKKRYYHLKGYSTIFLALALTGCSFVEDRSNQPVEIIDVSDGTRSGTMRNSKQQSETIQYTVRSGDTLGSIAKNMLGNAQRYLEIAKLNNIEPQAPIYVGQQLQLPSKGLILVKPKTTQQIATKPDKSAESKAQPSEMDSLLSQQRYYDAIEYARAQEDLSDNNELQERLIIATQNQVRLFRQEGLTGEAEELLQLLIDDGRLSESSQQILYSNLAALNVEQDLVEARQLADRQEFDDSYDILLSAWQVSGTELESNALFTGTRNKVSEHYHQNALQLYRNQELDEALIYWDKILAINPSDDLALVYKDRVKSLQAKLDSL
ncbi:MAG: LysM peptidoglycan-binding domain-containing protein [Kangiella sp.]|jgi:LysM repeat protein|nr:LysM peptidoglycan-binding domain-containing protein [Kangiella sp.]MCW9029692.1 LysM peptidoglycan-binding domain-containing protein [Kangiella sp.]